MTKCAALPSSLKNSDVEKIQTRNFITPVSSKNFIFYTLIKLTNYEICAPNAGI